MNTFSDLNLLDEYLRRVDEAMALSDDRAREMFQEFEWKRTPFADGDPYSPEFYGEQMGIYCALAGVSRYDTAQERSHFDVDQALRHPFPYHTASANTVGDHLMGIGFLIRTAGFTSGSRVLEFGPGWGNTTQALVQFGCRVTAIDIEPNFIELIQRRVQAVGLEVEAQVGDFNCFHDSDRVFDAVVFFECFHHCSDHLKLLRSLKRLVSSDGMVVFGAEPILDAFPVPWGVRLDGMSVWSIRKFKWLELGFQESYFVRTLMRLGWTVKKHTTSATSIGTVFVARHFQGTYQMGDFILPPDEDRTWAVAETDPNLKLRYSGERSRITIDQDSRWIRACVDVVNSAPFTVRLTLDAGGERTVRSLRSQERASVEVGLGGNLRVLTLSSTVWSPAKERMNEDKRQLGVCVLAIRLIAAGQA